MSNWFDKYYHVVIYALLIIVTSVPLLQPFGLPISISDSTKNYANSIDKLEDGDVVLFDLWFGPGSWTENGPQSVVTTKNLISKGVKIVFICLSADGPQMYRVMFDQINVPNNYEYGVDYVFLGYLSGGETAMAALTRDTWSLVQTDFFGTPIQDIPLMQQVRSIDDMDMLIVATSAQPQTWVRQWYEPYQKRMLLLAMSINVPASMTYIEAGQIEAYLAGGRGAAEYEVLTNKPGEAVTLTDAITIQHIFILLIIIAGNIIFFVQKPGIKVTRKEEK